MILLWIGIAVWIVSAIIVMISLALPMAFDDANRLPRWRRILLVAFAPLVIIGFVLMWFPPTRYIAWGIYETFRK